MDTTAIQAELERLKTENRKLNRRLERMDKEMRIMSSMHDQTQKLRDYSEREKQLQYEYNYLLLENAPDMLFVLDHAMRFRLGTKSFLSFLRQPDPGVLYDTPVETLLAPVMPADWVASTLTKFAEVAGERKHLQYADEVRLDGEARVFSMSIAPAIASTGEVMGVICLMHDSTELYRMKDDAEAATRSKSSFLASMSHEIRTPLNAVIGMAEIARRKSLGTAPEIVETIDEILVASKHLLGILNDVLDFSKIESGKLTLAHEAFSLQEAMTAIESMILQRCEEKAITLKTNLGQLPDITVMGDELRLKQVLINLLGNAVKFTAVRGAIRFRADVLDLSANEVTITFSVRDSGIGMSDEQIGKLFHAFEQTDSSVARRFGGTGLGLAISQRLTMEMGGEITVKSTPGDGSDFRFTLSLPVVAPADAETDAEAAADEGLTPDLTGKRILLVEDIRINRMILTELLSETNVTIEEAENGMLAVELFAKSPEGYYDLIFMDVQMPGIDGYETTRRIRALPRKDAEAVFIFAMTANAYREDVEKAMAATMDGHISKPVQIDQVLRLLAEKLTPRKKQLAQSAPCPL